jgi:hypothetical protein
MAACERVEHGCLAAPGKPDDGDLHAPMLPGTRRGGLSSPRSGPRR